MKSKVFRPARPGEHFYHKDLKMYNNLFNVLDYVKLCIGKKTNNVASSHIEHSQIIMSLLTECHIMRLNRLKI